MEDEKNSIHQLRKEILEKLVTRLSESRPDLYYCSTIEVAQLLHKILNEEGELNVRERKTIKTNIHTSHQI